MTKPGQDIIDKGMADLAGSLETVESLLVSIGAPRLRAAGLSVPDATFKTPDHRLYRLLAAADPDAAHARYNALIRRLVSYERALECGT